MDSSSSSSSAAPSPPASPPALPPGSKKRGAEEAAPSEEAGPGERGAPAAKRAKATGHPESWPEAELIRDHFFIDVTQPATQNLFTLEESVNW